MPSLAPIALRIENADPGQQRQSTLHVIEQPFAIAGGHGGSRLFKPFCFNVVIPIQLRKKIMRVQHSLAGKTWEKVRPIAMRVALLSMLWWILTGGETKGWFIGAATVVLAAAAAVPGQPAEVRRISMIGAFGFLFFFLARSLKGGMQVAAMAMRPDMRLAPAMLEITLRLPQERQRVFFATTVSLLPGTLSAGLEGSRFRLHVLDWRHPVEQEVREVETRIARLFGEELP